MSERVLALSDLQHLISRTIPIRFCLSPGLHEQQNEHEKFFIMYSDALNVHCSVTSGHNKFFKPQLKLSLTKGVLSRKPQRAAIPKSRSPYFWQAATMPPERQYYLQMRPSETAWHATRLSSARRRLGRSSRQRSFAYGQRG